jgi:hypothetical protein
VTGRVWYDADADGTMDPGETGLPNITVQLWSDTNGNGSHEAGEPLAHQMSSGAGGVFTFTLVHAGDYVASVDTTDPDLPAGMAAVGPTQRAVTGLAPGETRPGINFGFDDTGIIGGRVWDDANGNGGIDPGENPLPNVGVCLYQDNNANGQPDPGEPVTCVEPVETSAARIAAQAAVTVSPACRAATTPWTWTRPTQTCRPAGC